MFKKVRSLLAWSRVRLLFLPLIILAGILVAYFWQLGTLTAGFSPAETEAISSSANLSQIVDNPVNAPHRVVQYALSHISPEPWADRLPSVLFMLMFLVLFYIILRLWFGRWVAFTGTLFFAATAPLIILARSATPTILLLAPLFMMACALWLSRRTKYQSTVWLMFCVAAAVSLYVPGMLWFIIIVAAFKYRTALLLVKPLNKWVLASGIVLLIVLLSPLIYGLINTPAAAKELLLIPETFRGPLEIAKSIAWSILSLFWRLPYPTDFTIGRLPLLTLAQLALAAFGIYALWSKARSVVYWLSAMLGVSVLLSGINEKLSLLMPAIVVASLFVAAGLRYLFVEWNSVFPKNPIPRSLALTLMVLVVAIHVVYGLRYALVAWPNTPLVTEIYVIK